MTPRIPPSIGSEADQLETAFKAARIPEQLHDGLWDVWVDDPARAHHLIARFKDHGATPAVKFKAADARDVAYQQLCKAHDAGDTAGVQAALQQLTMLVAPASGAIGTHLSDSQKPSVATKDQGYPTRFVDDSGRPLARPIRDANGNQLP